MLLRSACLVALCVAGMTAPVAADVIGSATSAKNVVSGTLGAMVSPIGSGSEVSADELVTTGAGSAALLKFLDDTHLSIGESSTVLLDQFIYNPDGTAANAVVKLTRGAMRFVTGKSDPKNFSIQTEVATIGVRGTDFVVACDGVGTCIVAITKGVAIICPHPVTQFEVCPDTYDINTKRNFTLIGPDGTKGAQKITLAAVLRLYGAVAAGTKVDIASVTPPNGPFLPPVFVSPTVPTDN